MCSSYGGSTALPKRLSIKRVKRLDIATAVELEAMRSLARLEHQHWLVDASDSGSEPQEYATVRVGPGNYDVRVFEHAPRKDTKLIVCDLDER
jgi:hypothetical protein